MGNHDKEVLVSEHILVTYRHKDGVLAYRIPQQELERLQKLEHLVVVAREEIQQRIELGFKEETGELVVDRGAFERQEELRRRLVRPSRAREGKSPRVFVLSSRERFYVQAWVRGDVEGSDRALKILQKLQKRTWCILRRECQAMSVQRSWSDTWSLFHRERIYWKDRAILAFFIGLHKMGIDERVRIGEIFGAQLSRYMIRRDAFLP